MARAIRPVLVLMLLASLLFVVDGILDGVYPGGPAWIGSNVYYGLGPTSYVFAALNLLIASLIAAGSERSLVARIGVAMFFVIERPATAFVLGPKPVESVAVHLATALVELVILVSALRVWRLGHRVESLDLDALLSLERPSPAAPSEPDDPPAPGARRRRASVWVGLIALVLAAVFVADAIQAGYLPNGRAWGLSAEASGWLAYLFAATLLVAAARAVRGGALALRVILVLALIFFVERAFSPIVLKISDGTLLGLHGLAAFASLVLALAAVSALRSNGDRAPAGFPAAQTT